MNTYEIIQKSPLFVCPWKYIKDVPPGLIMEFGVANGFTIRDIAQETTRTVYGFDSFWGLPEKWGHVPVGEFSRNGIPPNIEYDNIEYVVGMFQDTLIPFLDKHPEPIAFVHIDVDLYSSCAFVLENIEKRLQSGTIIEFDEMVDWHEHLNEDDSGHWKNCEYKAFNEMLDRNPTMQWECLSRWCNHQVAIRIC